MNALAAPASLGLQLTVTEESLIHVKGLTKRFPLRRGWLETLRHPRSARRLEALRDVTFEVRHGEIVALVGPNGAGKSTLFRLLSTLLIPDAGTATIAGYDLLKDAPKVRTAIGLVNPDERSLNWRLSARENLRLYAALHGLRRKELQRRVDEVLGTVELTDNGGRMVGTYSSGMRQRLLIARALLAEPQVLLLDEPTRSLDPVAARHFRMFLREVLAKHQRCTVLLATHNAEEALDLCDRAAILHQGRLLAIGSPSYLLRRLGAERFQIGTRTPGHAVFSDLERAGALGNLARAPNGDGWTVLECDIRGGEGQSAAVLAAMVRAGAEIGRFVRVQPALAELMEHQIHCSANGGLPDA